MQKSPMTIRIMRAFFGHDGAHYLRSLSAVETRKCSLHGDAPLPCCLEKMNVQPPLMASLLVHDLFSAPQPLVWLALFLYHNLLFLAGFLPFLFLSPWALQAMSLLSCGYAWAYITVHAIKSAEKNLFCIVIRAEEIPWTVGKPFIAGHFSAGRVSRLEALNDA